MGYTPDLKRLTLQEYAGMLKKQKLLPDESA